MALARFLTHSDGFFSHSLASSSKLDSPSSLGLVPHCFLRHLEFPHLPLLALHRPSTGFSSLFRLAPPQSLGLSPVGSELLAPLGCHFLSPQLPLSRLFIFAH